MITGSFGTLGAPDRFVQLGDNRVHCVLRNAALPPQYLLAVAALDKLHDYRKLHRTIEEAVPAHNVRVAFYVPQQLRLMAQYTCDPFPM